MTATRVSRIDGGNSVFGRPWFVVRFLWPPRVADRTHVHIRSRRRSRSIEGSVRAKGVGVDRSAGRRPPTTKEEAEEQEREPANGACDDEDEEISRDRPCSTGAGVGVGRGAAGS